MTMIRMNECHSDKYTQQKLLLKERHLIAFQVEERSDNNENNYVIWQTMARIDRQNTSSMEFA